MVLVVVLCPKAFGSNLFSTQVSSAFPSAVRMWCWVSCSCPRESKLLELADGSLLWSPGLGDSFEQSTHSPSQTWLPYDMVYLWHGLPLLWSSESISDMVHFWCGTLLTWLSPDDPSNIVISCPVYPDMVLLYHGLLGDMILLWHGSPLTWPYWSSSNMVHLWHDPFLTWPTFGWAASVCCCWPSLTYSYSRKSTWLSNHFPLCST